MGHIRAINDPKVNQCSLMSYKVPSSRNQAYFVSDHRVPQKTYQMAGTPVCWIDAPNKDVDAEKGKKGFIY
jgi:hypothetical protein